MVTVAPRAFASGEPGDLLTPRKQLCRGKPFSRTRFISHTHGRHIHPSGWSDADALLKRGLSEVCFPGTGLISGSLAHLFIGTAGRAE